MKKILLLTSFFCSLQMLMAQQLPKALDRKKMHKEEMLSVPFTKNNSEDVLLARDYDNSIYSLPYGTSATERYVMNPNFSAILASEIQNDGEVLLTTGATMKNIGNLTLTGVKVNTVINYYALSGGSATKIFDKNSTDKFDLEKDSIVGLTVEPFDFNSAKKGAGRYSFLNTVGQDSADQAKGDNTYTSNMYVLNNIMSKGRIAPTTKALQITQYWGGGTSYRETLVPLSTQHAKGLTIDTLFAAIASNEGVADIYAEGRIYKWEDLNSDQDVSSDELTLVAVGAYTVPSTTSGNFTNLRIGLDPLVGSGARYEIEDNTLYFASLMYPGGSKSFFVGYDMVPSLRMLVNTKDAAGTLQFEDYPYLSSRMPDAATGNPDMSSVALFYVDLNSDGSAQDEEVFYFPVAMAIQFGGAVATKDLTNQAGIEIKINPNPAKEIASVKVALKESSKVKIELYNLNGTLIEAEERNAAGSEFTKEFNVSNLSAGTYIVKATTENGFVRKPFSVIK